MTRDVSTVPLSAQKYKILDETINCFFDEIVTILTILEAPAIHYIDSKLIIIMNNYVDIVGSILIFIHGSFEVSLHPKYDRVRKILTQWKRIGFSDEE